MTGKEHEQKRPRFSIIAGASSAEQVQQLASQFDINIGASSQTELNEEDTGDFDDPYGKPSVVEP
jgi:aryl-alcohol dehydrogenase-like predicted oxidoreductase